MRRFVAWLIVSSVFVGLRLLIQPEPDYLGEANAFLTAEIVRLQPRDGRSVVFESSYELLRIHSARRSRSTLEIGDSLQQVGYRPIAQYTLSRIGEFGVYFDCTVIDPSRRINPGHPTASGELFVRWKGGDVNRWLPIEASLAPAPTRNATGRGLLPLVNR